jgi:transcriptional regulator with XRE-family HTH domain
MQKQFGKRLRDLRLARNLTQPKLAERSGVAEKYLSDIERGKVNVSLTIMTRLAVGLGVPVKELFAVDAEPTGDDDRQVARDLVAAITVTADDEKAARLRLFLERVFR